MKTSLRAAALTAALLRTSSAKNIVDVELLSDTTLPRQSSGGNGTFSISLDTKQLPTGFIPSVNISIGTPPQTYAALIDTASNALWAPDLTSPFCQLPIDLSACSQSGTSSPFYFGGIDPNKSSTLQPVNNASLGPFSIVYGDGTTVNGSYFEDTLTFDNKGFQGIDFAIVNNATTHYPEFGNWGVGTPRGQGIYPSVIPRIVQAGAIACNMISVWMNGYGTALGSVLFGGIDTAKFNPPMTFMPMITQGEAASWYSVPWTSVTIGIYDNPSQNVTAANQSFPLNVATVLDTGTSTISLPNSIFAGVGEALGITDPNTNFCPFAEAGIYFTLEFNNDPSSRITINGSDIIKPKLENNGSVTLDQTDGSPWCSSPFSATNNSYATLGSPFLQAAYVVFDNDNNVVGMAQARLNATDNSVQACSSTSAGIPGASGTPSLTVSLTSYPPPTGAPAATEPPGQNPGPTGSVVSAVAASPTLSFLSAATGSKTGSNPAATSSKGAAAANAQIPSITAVSMIPLFMPALSMMLGGMAFLL